MKGTTLLAILVCTYAYFWYLNDYVNPTINNTCYLKNITNEKTHMGCSITTRPTQECPPTIFPCTDLTDIPGTHDCCAGPTCHASYYACLNVPYKTRMDNGIYCHCQGLKNALVQQTCQEYYTSIVTVMTTDNKWQKDILMHGTTKTQLCKESINTFNCWHPKYGTNDFLVTTAPIDTRVFTVDFVLGCFFAGFIIGGVFLVVKKLTF
jgi:hypothetical protein